MRLDHLLSKEEEVEKSRVCFTVELLRTQEMSGGDALTGNTRSHPEHDG